MRKNINNNLSIKKTGKLQNYVLIAVCAILAISSIFMTIESATIGMEMSKIEKTQSQLANQKRDLEETLVRTLSLAELQQKGAEMGFVKADNLVYVSSDSYVANAENVTGMVPVAKLP